MANGSDLVSNALIESLLDGIDFTVPVIDMSGPLYELPSGTTSLVYQQLEKIPLSEVTTGTVDGTGVFDVLMRTVSAHVRAEYSSGRITGSEYSKVYINSIQAALGAGIQFVVQRDGALWQAITAQAAVIAAKVSLEATKIEYLNTQMRARNLQAEYALTKIKLSNEDAAYGVSKYNLETMLPEQLNALLEQIKLTKEQIEVQRAQTVNNRTDGTIVAGIMGKQKEVFTEQINLTKEQIEVQRAQTLNTRTDGITIVGSVGKQKELYTQQITSYQRDAEVKAAKMFTDAWITMKSIDEGLLPPANFENTSLNAILADIKLNNNIG